MKGSGRREKRGRRREKVMEGKGKNREREERERGGRKRENVMEGEEV